MSWKECSPVSQRQEFVALARSAGANISVLCRRYGISRKTGYKWLGRAGPDGSGDYTNRSRRPRRSPRRTAAAVEQSVLEARRANPVWGGRKLRRILINEGAARVPAASTITTILRRHGLIDPAQSQLHLPLTRFEHPRPNDLWQMDFKGHFGLRSGTRCHPLTVLDDHSRFCLGLRSCADERGTTVRQELTTMFRRYGLPWRMVMDNGSPWGGEGEFGHTPLTVWLLRLGISVCHGRAYHPQTQGKDERFHRTLKLELLSRRSFEHLDAAQRGFNHWRDAYNLQRPHEALGLEVPASRYRASVRAFPEVLPAIEYPSGDQVRTVGMHGRISYRGRVWKVPRALRGEPVAIRPSVHDGVLDVYYCDAVIAVLNLAAPPDDDAPPRAGPARCARGTGPRRVGLPHPYPR